MSFRDLPVVTIGPYWCASLNAWLKFDLIESEKGKIAQYGPKISVQTTSHFTEDWQRVEVSGEPIYWTLWDADNQVWAAYCLADDYQLYRTEGKQHPISHSKVISLIDHEGGQIPKRTGLFDSYLLEFPLEPIDLPLYPEQRLQQAEQERLEREREEEEKRLKDERKEQALQKMWQKYDPEVARQKAIQDCKSCIKNITFGVFEEELNSNLVALDPRNFDCYSYLTILSNISTDYELIVKLKDLSARTEFDDQIKSKLGIIESDWDKDELRRYLIDLKLEYFMEIINGEKELLSNEIGLIENGIGSSSIVDHEEMPDHPVEQKIAPEEFEPSPVLPLDREALLRAATARATLSNATPKEEEIHAGAIVTSEKEKPEVPEEETERRKLLHAKLMEKLGNSAPRDDLLLIQNAVNEAQKKYSDWYAKLSLWHDTPSPARGPNGFFTWFRHGEHGQQKALMLNNDIQGLKGSSEEAKVIINTFLNDSKTRYHRHSFSSFLLDELNKIPDSPWKVSANELDLYNKEEICLAIKSLK